MKYASVCSGIEAASVAWDAIGWEPAWFSEIDPFACALLAEKYPNVRNLGDMTKIQESDLGRFDLLVGGTPCQSFSVAGLRGGLGDARGNLALRFVQLAHAARPRWVVWENVPGVLSSGGGRDFGSILGGLAECGYGLAYRVLDAQYVRVDGYARAVPQRRNRVFVVGYLGDWRRAAAVLFELAGVRGDHPPRREAGEGTAHPVAPCVDASGVGFARTGDIRGQDPVVAMCLNAGAQGRIDAESETLLVAGTLQHGKKSSGSMTLQDATSGQWVAHTLKGDGSDGSDGSEDGTGRGTPLPIHGLEHAMPQTRRNGDPGVVAFTQNQVGDVLTGDVFPAMGTNSNATGRNTPKVNGHSGVRRLTPRECERLQGFPDDYTLITYRKKPAADAPRYRAIGNSMAVNVMRWIGRRIEAVERISA